MITDITGRIIYENDLLIFVGPNETTLAGYVFFPPHAAIERVGGLVCAKKASYLYLNASCFGGPPLLSLDVRNTGILPAVKWVFKEYPKFWRYWRTGLEMILSCQGLVEFWKNEEGA